jgi:uncharacterized protein (TIGR03437 family)
MIADMIRYRLCILTVILAGIALSARPAFAQLPGLSSLQGAYNVRYLGSNTNPADSAVSFSGTITFDGKGGFTVTGQGASAASSNHTLAFLTSGQYNVFSNGMIQITNPFDPSSTTSLSTATTVLYGGLGNGILVASSTDTSYCDVFVAIQAASGASNSTLSGTYQMASLEFLNADFTQTRDTFFSAAADGKGGLGNVTIKGTAQNLNGTATTQTSSGATYTVTANGTGTMNLPAPSGVAAGSVLLSGNKVLYVSADGSFFVAGSATGYDMEVGTKAVSSATAPNGIFFQGLLQNFAAGTSSDGLYSAQGAANEIGSSNLEIGHQRTNPDGFSNFDYTFSDTLTFGADGTVTYGDSFYAVGAGGNIIIGAGAGSNYQLIVYAKSVPMNGTGVFLNPQGVVNAASSTPFTSSFSPGEVVTFYGTNIGGSTAQASAPFPTTLGGAQVSVAYTDSTGKAVTAPLPLYYVSQNQISGVLPFTIPQDGSVLTFQVNNGGTASNTTSVYSGQTSPGLFTVPAGGIGPGAILHADFSLVSSSSPAKSGETVQVFLNGLGAVNSTLAAGQPAPTSSLVTLVNPVQGVWIYDPTQGPLAANVVFAGLAPGLAGLYQMNITLPTGLSAGNLPIEVATTDGDNIQAVIPISK